MSAVRLQRLKFVDETGMTLQLTRRYGRATPGQRVGEGVPDNYGANHTMVAALSLKTLSAPWVIEGAVNGDIFRTWVRDALCPTLRAGDIVIWDNLQAHKVAGLEDLIAARGAHLQFLSPYSPDFNPIEHCWAKLKTHLRKAKARTVKALLKALKTALATVTKTDMKGWFTHCGYPLH